MQAKRFISQPAYICLFRCWKILSLSYFFPTSPVRHHSGCQRQKEAADGSVTSSNQLIPRQRIDFQPRQLQCFFTARLSASQSGEVHSDEGMIQDTHCCIEETNRSRRWKYNTSDLFSEFHSGMHVHPPMQCLVTFCSQDDVGVPLCRR